jgi:hypothetical protein
LFYFFGFAQDNVNDMSVLSEMSQEWELLACLKQVLTPTAWMVLTLMVLTLMVLTRDGFDIFDGFD